MAPYAPKDYGRLLGTPGFSENLLKTHFALYQGYVANTNKLLDLQAKLVLEGQGAAPEFAETRRRLGWEFDGMRLHELYFENLGGKAPLDPGSKLGAALVRDFGSLAAWEKDFRATGAMRGIGWAALYQDPTNGRLIDFWINEHDAGHAASCRLILIMDVFEHAFMPDYGTKRADYIEAFMKAVDWTAAEARLG